MQARERLPAKGERILSLKGISKKFGAVSALTDIDLDVHAGEVVALVGDNGAGKSTLVKVLAGVHQPTSGDISYMGRPVTLDSPAKALEMGIATVFQDLALCENLDVVANLFLGHELSPWRLDEVQMEVRAWTLLKELAARIPSVREPVASLSGGQRQTVAIARSLLLDPPGGGTARRGTPGRGPPGSWSGGGAETAASPPPIHRIRIWWRRSPGPRKTPCRGGTTALPPKQGRQGHDRQATTAGTGPGRRAGAP